MRKRLPRLWVLPLFLALFCVAWFVPKEAQAAPLLKYGSKTGDVWDLQYRLSVLGYYKGKIDGIMGWQTVQAVKNYQRDYGLKPDGIVGPQTWASLKKYTLSRDEVYLVARAVYGEARGEPYKGQVAVAAVIMNRIQSPSFPDTAWGVIFQKGAFSVVDDGQIWYTPNQTAINAVKDAVRGWDPTGGALYYFNPNTATSAWIWSRPQLVKIGNHIFTA
ncbi:spore cortex-lytic enzyme [Bacillaceae bacterium]